MDVGRLVEMGAPGELLERHRSESLEEVFAAVTGRNIDDSHEGRLSDVRAQRRVAHRLG
jgi:hypothetical protein